MVLCKLYIAQAPLRKLSDICHSAQSPYIVKWKGNIVRPIKLNRNFMNHHLKDCSPLAAINGLIFYFYFFFSVTCAWMNVKLQAGHVCIPWLHVQIVTWTHVSLVRSAVCPNSTMRLEISWHGSVEKVSTAALPIL